jgi:L-ribulose-5-phosphate 4-epimerase
MLDSLRAEVYEANMEVVRRGLVLYTFGNASGISRDEGLVAIKPSGVSYDTLRPEHLVISDLDGHIVEGKLKPSSDLPTHLALYRAFPAIGGVVHTHSRYATSWAQACREIPCLGTTHADYFHGPVPVTDAMPHHEIESDYEWNTGQSIVRRFAGMDPLSKPGVLVAGHAPFCWGATPVVLEEIACLAYHALAINPSATAVSDALRDKHFLRKHGPKAYYGQKKTSGGREDG